MYSKLSMVVRVWLFDHALKLPSFLTAPLGIGVRSVEGEPVSDRLRWMLRLLRFEPVDAPHTAKRAIFDSLSNTSVVGPTLDVRIEDRMVPGDPSVPIRIYRPHGAVGPLPTLFWIHGGGWVIGSIDSHDAFCRRVCLEAGIAVVAADYRRGPEHPFPAPEQDVTRVWQWMRAEAESEGFDPMHLGMGGDSAGGNLTAVLCQQLPVAERPMCQILCYPATDASKPTDSKKKWSTGYLLDQLLIDRFLEWYCSGQGLDDPRISPLLNPALSAQPSAMVITAGMDPLNDEGRAYADRLEDTGVAVDRYHIAPMIHGFINLYGALPEADQAVAEIIGRIGTHLRA